MWKNEITFLLLSIFHSTASYFFRPNSEFVAATKDEVCGETSLTTATAKSISWTAPIKQMNASTVCKYVINSDPGKLVALTLTKVELSVPTKGVEVSNVKIVGFMDDVRTEIATITITSSTKFYSTGSKMEVTITAVGTVKAEAVQGSFESVNKFCAEQNLIAVSDQAKTWSVQTGTFVEGKVCVYRIKAQPDEVVEFKFTQPAAGVAAKQKTCQKPSVKLENFVEGQQTLITELCQGDRPADVYTSTKQEMIVTVHGGDQAIKSLFAAEYKSIPDPDCGPVKFTATPTPSNQWSIPLRQLASDKICTYFIESDASQVVELNITSFDRQIPAKSSECEIPYLKLENEVEAGRTLIEDLCDNTYPKTVSSNSSKMAVTLFGKQGLKANAVNMVYESISLEDICGTLSFTAEENSSAEWKAPAKDMTLATTCAYTIKSSDERPIEITFQSIDVGQEESECNKPYVKIKEVGSDSQTKDIATICGKKSNVKYTSTTSKMIIILEGVKDLKKDSFTATYKTGFAMRIQFGFFIPLLIFLSFFSNF